MARTITRTSEDSALEIPTAPAPATQAPTADPMALIAKQMERQNDLAEAQLRGAPRRKTTLAEYRKRNPRKTLYRPVFQNGRLVNPAGLSDETIARLDTLASGRYANGMIDVVRVGDGAQSRIHIMYANANPDQRSMFYMQFPSFTVIVNKVVEEMAAKGAIPVNDPRPNPPDEDDAE